MFIQQLFEDSAKRIIVTYPGRFQPFHKGHAEVFANLQRQFGSENVFIVTSNKTDAAKSPFNFSDKVRFMHAMGIPNHQIIETDKVYDIPSRFEPVRDQVVFITVVGAPDAKRLNPGATKKDGSQSYFQNIPQDKNEFETADKHGYVIVEPEHPETISIGGKTYDVSHGTPTRELWNQIRDNPQQRGEFVTQLYGRADSDLANTLDKIPTGAAPAPAPAAKMKNVKKDLSKVQHDPNAVAESNDYEHGFADPNAPQLGAGAKAGAKRAELQHELGHEQNNLAIAINGKTWKVIPGKGYADSFEERSYLKNMQNWAAKKSASSGKKWTVHLTGAPITVDESFFGGVKSAIGPWFLKKDGDVLRTVNGQPFTFKSKEEAVKWAMKTYKVSYNQQNIIPTTNPDKNLMTPKGAVVSESAGPVTHRIGLTVTDPNHPMVSKRSETIQKTVRVKGDDREKAINGAIAHYRRKGYKVHDHHYIGTVDNEPMAEGVAETLPMSDAVKVLKHYGADHFKTTSNELHFYTKNGRGLSVDLVWNDDATRSVNLSSLNSATRALKGQGVAEGFSSGYTYKDTDEGTYLTNTMGETLFIPDVSLQDQGFKPGDRRLPEVWQMNLEMADETGAYIVDDEQGVAEGSKYKCSCHPGDPDPDCPVHGLEPMEVGDALDVKKGVAEAKAATASFRAGDKKRAKLNSMSDEERRAHDKEQQEKQRKRDDARLERERSKNMAEGATGAKPGWMLKQDPALAKKVKDSKRGHEELKKWAGKPVPKDDKQVEEGAELKQTKRKYNQAAKDANDDQVGAGKKIDTMKKSLRQKDVDNKKQGVAEASNQLVPHKESPLDLSSDYAYYIAGKGNELLATFKKLFARANSMPTEQRDKFYKNLASTAANGDLGDTILAYSKTISFDDLWAIDEVFDHYGLMFHGIAWPDDFADYEQGWKQYASDVVLARTHHEPGQTMHEQGMAEGGLGLDHKRNRFKSLRVRENAEELSVGDPVVITGQGIEFEGKTGDIDSFGEGNRFVVVNLYNHGKHSFHSSDVSYNDYADEQDDLDEDLYQYDKEDPYNSEFAPRAGMGRMTLRGWKQQMIKRTAELAQQMAAAGQDIDKSALWDNVHAKLKSMNMDPIAQEIEQAQAELARIRSQGGVRSRAFGK